MAEEPQSNPQVTLRSINWREVFPFTNIFRAFRVAVHPSKLVLGLMALLTLYAGGRILDAVWPTAGMANHGEATAYQTFGKGGDTAPAGHFSDKIRDDRRTNQEQYASGLRDLEILTDPKVIDEAARSFSRMSEMKSKIMWMRNDMVAKAERQRDADLAEANKVTDATQRDARVREIRDRFESTRQEADRRVATGMERLDRVKPRGVFEEFFEYEVQQVNGVAAGVVANQWVGTGGVFPRIYNFFAVGPVWLWKYHTVYAVLFTVLFLLTWAVFGGAISRIAAVQVARDEKISVRQALRFSLNKVLSFVFAPVIPLVIVLVLGLLIAIGGLLMYVPWGIGPVLVGGMFFLALIAGVVITLVLFGTVGGLNLMFPTIAVEGSDSFDAISRSFSYVFARPWRMLLYTLVAIVYGALTYLFVRFFVWVVLLVTHHFASLLLGGQPGQYFDRIWPAPLPYWDFRLPYDLNGAGLHWMDRIGAFLISFWNYLLIGLVGAYAISYYLSVSTIIYGLMRREVDATELEDVYVEEAEDDLADIAPPAVATAGTPATTTTAAAATSAAASTLTTSTDAAAVGDTPGSPADIITPVVPPPGDMPPPSNAV